MFGNFGRSFATASGTLGLHLLPHDAPHCPRLDIDATPLAEIAGTTLLDS